MPGNKHPTERTGRNPVKEPSNKATKLLLKYTPKKLQDIYKNSNRNTKLAGTLIIVLILVGGLALILTKDDQQIFNTTEDIAIENQERELQTAKVAILEGTLQTKNDEGEWEDVDMEFIPTENSALRTVGATSRAAIELGDGSVFRLDANTEIKILSLAVDRFELLQTSGYVYNRVIESNTRQYIVKTNEAQYEALGTAFKTISSGDEQAVEAYQNNVIETSNNITVTQGEKLVVKNNINPVDEKIVTKLDIELIKNDSFVEWNIDLDKQNDLFKDKLGFLSDTEGPEITINSHSDGETILLEPNATEGVVEFTGYTEKGASLTVLSKSSSGTKPVTVTVGDDGNFTTPILTAPLGDSVFEFNSKDRRGNKTTLNFRVNFQRKSQPVENDNISLNIEVGAKVNLSWNYSGNVSAEDGVKIVWSENKNPKYPSDNPIYVESGKSASIKLDEFSSKETYYFRVCEYNESTNKCGIYSNEVEIDIP